MRKGKAIASIVLLLVLLSLSTVAFANSGEDNGNGSPAEKIERARERFEQAQQNFLNAKDRFEDAKDKRVLGQGKNLHASLHRPFDKLFRGYREKSAKA